MRITQIFIIENNYIKKVLLVFIFIFYISLLKDSNIFISSITNLKSSFFFFFPLFSQPSFSFYKFWTGKDINKIGKIYFSLFIYLFFVFQIDI